VANSKRKGVGMGRTIVRSMALLETEAQPLEDLGSVIGEMNSVIGERGRSQESLLRPYHNG
jgi:hypothetical protein